MEKLLGLVWSEVTATTVQEGNWEGMVLQILLKILFHHNFIISRICSGTDQHLHFREMGD